MSDELLYSFDKFCKALNKLDDGIKKAKDQLDNDGVIQRFEFTFELCWKTLRLYLMDEGIITRSPKETFKESFKYGLFVNQEIFYDMLEDRNLTSHLYSQEISKEIVKRIKTKYNKAFKELKTELSNLLPKRSK